MFALVFLVFSLVFLGMILSESLLKEVNFNNVRLNKIKYDEETLFPEWLNQEKRDKYGMIFELR